MEKYMAQPCKDGFIVADTPPSTVMAKLAFPKEI
jgi:hypothetical protein